MRPLAELAPSWNDWKRAVLVGALASVAYTGLVFWSATRSSSDVVITGPFWQFLGLYSLFAFGTIGVPLLLWIRYGIRGPSLLLAIVLLFWHVLVDVPPIVSGAGHTPGFTFVFLFAPAYLVAYGFVAGGEYWLLGRRFSVGADTS